MYVSCIALLFAAAWYCYNNDIILIRKPHVHTLVLTADTAHKKAIKLYLWHHDAWHFENAEIIWSTDIVSTVHNLIARWLVLIAEEQNCKQPAKVVTVALGSDLQTIYLNFDHLPLDRQKSTYDNVMILEGLLKTIRENGIKLTALQFLVNHTPLQDAQLDFSQPWPITGFLNQN
jgi:hypothetical protein